MMVRNTTQLAQPVPEASSLPTRMPSLPEDVLKRFPSTGEFNRKLEQFWATTRELIINDHNELAYSANSLKAAEKLLTATQGSLLSEIRRVDAAWIAGDAAISETIDTLVASSTRVHTFLQSSDPASPAIGDLWFKISEGFRLYRFGASGWEPVDDTRIAGALAAITEESETRATQTSALATDLTALVARLDTGDIATALSSLQTAVGPTGALATSINSLSARLGITGDIGAAINTIQTTYATQAFAEAKRDEAITAAVTTANAYTTASVDGLASTYATQTFVTGQINSLSSVYATQTSVNTQVSSAITAAVTSANQHTDTSIDGLSTVYATQTSVASQISNLASVYATQTSVSSQVSSAITSAVSTAGSYTDGQIATLSSVYLTPAQADVRIGNAISASLSSSSAGTIGGAINNLSSVYVTPTQVTAAISTSLASSAGGTIGAALNVEAETRATADGFLSGKYTIRVDSNGSVAGMNISSTSNAGTNTSEVSFLASVFKIYTADQPVAPFTVVGNTVRVSGDLIINSTDVDGLGTLATANTVDLVTQVTNKSLYNLDNTAGTKLAGIEAGATVGAAWGTNLTGRPLELTDGRIVTALNAAGTVVTRVVPGSAASPTSAGLYLGSDRLGFYSGSAWKTYMDNSGNFYLSGASTNALAWDGTSLTVSGQVNCGSGDLFAANARFFIDYYGFGDNGTTLGLSYNSSSTSAVSMLVGYANNHARETGRLMFIGGADTYNRTILDGRNASSTVYGSLEFNDGYADGDTLPIFIPQGFGILKARYTRIRGENVSVYASGLFSVTGEASFTEDTTVGGILRCSEYRAKTGDNCQVSTFHGTAKLPVHGSTGVPSASLRLHWDANTESFYISVDGTDLYQISVTPI